MRVLLGRTVRTAVQAGLVDLALQGVDGARIAANASKDRTVDAKGLRRLLDRVAAAIEDLEAQNAREALRHRPACRQRLPAPRRCTSGLGKPLPG